MTCPYGFSCIFTHPWKHLFLHKVYEKSIEIQRVGINKYIPSCFVHYLLLKLEFSSKLFWVTFMRQTNLNFLWSTWVKFNMRFMKHYERLTFSCIFNGQRSIFAIIQFWVWSKSPIFREIHTTRIHRYFCYLHILTPNIFSISKDFIPIHLVHREIFREA